MEKPRHALIDWADLREAYTSLDESSVRDVVGFEGLYRVTRDGRVYSSDRYETFQGRWGLTTRKRAGVLIKDWDSRGYRQVNLHRDGKVVRKSVHRLVAEAFIPNPEGYPEVNHIDENRANNCVSNLEWTDRRGNALHSVYKTSGSKSHFSILNEDDVVRIKKKIREGSSNLDIAEEYGVAHSTISKIRTGTNWKHVK